MSDKVILSRKTAKNHSYELAQLTTSDSVNSQTAIALHDLRTDSTVAFAVFDNIESDFLLWGFAPAMHKSASDLFANNLKFRQRELCDDEGSMKLLIPQSNRGYKLIIKLTDKKIITTDSPSGNSAIAINAFTSEDVLALLDVMSMIMDAPPDVSEGSKEFNDSPSVFHIHYYSGDKSTLPDLLRKQESAIAHISANGEAYGVLTNPLLQAFKILSIRIRSSISMSSSSKLHNCIESVECILDECKQKQDFGIKTNTEKSKAIDTINFGFHLIAMYFDEEGIQHELHKKKVYSVDDLDYLKGNPAVPSELVAVYIKLIEKRKEVISLKVSKAVTKKAEFSNVPDKPNFSTEPEIKEFDVKPNFARCSACFGWTESAYKFGEFVVPNHKSRCGVMCDGSGKPPLSSDKESLFLGIINDQQSIIKAKSDYEIQEAWIYLSDKIKKLELLMHTIIT